MHLVHDANLCVMHFDSLDQDSKQVAFRLLIRCGQAVHDLAGESGEVPHVQFQFSGLILLTMSLSQRGFLPRELFFQFLYSWRNVSLLRPSMFVGVQESRQSTFQAGDGALTFTQV